MALIVALSSDVGSAEHTAHWLVPILRLLAPGATPTQLHALHGLVRKGGHLTEYAVLAALWYRAFVGARRLRPGTAAAVAFAISVVWAVLDEAHQSFEPSRTASPRDVAIDSIGAFLAVLVATLGWRITIDRTTTVLLWTALVGGLAFLLLNALTGVPSGYLWLTAPLAAVLLVARTLYTRHQSGPRP
jgi:VanZ family protein